MMNPPKRFQPCELCTLRQQTTPTFEGCPVRQTRQIGEQELDFLKKHTPLAQWQSPKQLSDEFGFSTKHIVRLVSNPENRIAAFVQDRRWLILRCSFTRFMDEHG